jgi:hypothetical protein
MEEEALRQRLAALLDKDEIREQLARYCRGVDRGDDALITGLYHPDATVDHGIFRCRGDEAAAHVRAIAPAAGLHLVGSVAIEIEGDVAYSESYNLVYSLAEPDAEGSAHTYLRGSRYVDRWERRDGAWRIAFRISVTELGRWDEVCETGPPSWPDVRGPRSESQSTTFGAQAPDDVVYLIRDEGWRQARAIR